MNAARRASGASRLRDTGSRLKDLARRILGADSAWSVMLVAVTVTMIGAQRCGSSVEGYRDGEVAREEIVAQRDLDVIDVALTEQRRAEARATVPEVYVFDTQREDRSTRALARMFERGRSALDSGEAADPTVVPGEVRDLALPALAAVSWSEGVQDVLEDIVSRAHAGPVVGNRALLWSEPRVLVVTVPQGGERVLQDFEEVRDLDEARSRVRADVRRLLDLDESVEVALAELAAAFVDTNLGYDPEGTRTRRARAASEVLPVRVRIPRGTVVVRQGARVEAQAAATLAAMRGAALGRLDPAYVIGLVLFAAALAFFLYRYASYHQRGFHRLRHLHALLVVVLVGILGVATALTWLVGEATAGVRPPFGEIERYMPMIPLGASAVLIALLANGRIAMVHATFVAILFGALRGWDLYATVWAALVQWAGVYAVTTYRDRASLLRAGVVVGSAGAVAYLATEALRDGFAHAGGPLYGAALGLVGGAVLTGLVVSFTLPLLEGTFNVLTEIRLLELSNLDNPLLSQLAVKAPGSYNHSLVVGTLAEEGAKAIGANALFCRVAAVYHDIGKMTKPEYFVENQRGANPHDRLSPSMSALILVSHVKDGLRLAREAGLPEQIADIIPQHHGTRLMTYFFEKAKVDAEALELEVDEREYRYPGPKPQSREAAIFMLADAAEAAARTIEDPNPNRLREMIRRVTEAIVLDRQFDECELTFADLERVREAFLRSLTSMYHHRVDYPGFEFNRQAPDVVAEGATVES